MQDQAESENGDVPDENNNVADDEKFSTPVQDSKQADAKSPKTIGLSGMQRQATFDIPDSDDEGSVSRHNSQQPAAHQRPSVKRKADLQVKHVRVVSDSFSQCESSRKEAPLETERGLLDDNIATDAPLGLFTEQRLVTDEDDDNINALFQDDDKTQNQHLSKQKFQEVEEEIKEFSIEEAQNSDFQPKIYFEDQDDNMVIAKKRDIFVPKPKQDFAGDIHRKISLLGLMKYGGSVPNFIIGCIFAFLNGIFGTTHAIILGNLIGALNPYDSQNQDSVNEKMKEIVVQVIFYILAMALLSFLQGYFMKKSAAQLSNAIHNSFLESLLTQETAYFESIDLDSLPEQIRNKFDNLNKCIENNIGSLIFAIGALCSALIISLAISPGYTLALFLAFPSLICLKKCISFGTGNYNAKDDYLYDFASDMIRAVKIIITSGQERQTIQRFENQREKMHYQSVRQHMWLGLSQVANLVLLLCFLLYAWVVLGLFIEGEWENISTGERHTVTDCFICMEAFAYAMLFVPLILTLSPQIRQAKKDGSDLVSVIERQPEIRDQMYNYSSIYLNSSIFFAGVTFKYPNAPEHAQPVFINADFKMSTKQITALVGKKGSGKSTLLKLLYRLYDPTEGAIFYGDDDDLRSYKLKAYRSQVVFIESQSALFAGSIEENLQLGNADLTPDQINEAIEMANAGFVHDLKHGLQTSIGQQYSRIELNESQKLRIVLARALISDPKVLLIDDLTQGLDPQGAKQVQMALDNILRHARLNRKTVIIATQCMHIIEKTNRVLFIQDSTSVISAAKDTEAHKNVIKQLETTIFANQDADLQNNYADVESVNLSLEQQSDEEEVQQYKPKILPNKIVPVANIVQDRQVQQKKRRFNEIKEDPKVLLGKNFVDEGMLKCLLLLTLVNSLSYPLIGYILIRLQVLLFSFSEEVEGLKSFDQESYDDNKVLISILFIGAIVFTLIMHGIAQLKTAQIAQNIEESLRSKLLKSILSKEILWFDKSDSSSLANIIVKDVSQLSKNVLKRYLLIPEITVLIVSSVIIGFSICWQQTIFALFLSPLLCLSVKMAQEMVWNGKNYQKKLDSEEDAHNLLKEIILNYRTVTSLSEVNRSYFNQKYDKYRNRTLNAEMNGLQWPGLNLMIVHTGHNIFLLVIFVLGVAVSIDYLEQPADQVIISTVMLFTVFVVVGFKLGNLPNTEFETQRIFEIIGDKTELAQIERFDKQLEGKLNFKSEIQFGRVEMRDVMMFQPGGQNLSLDGLNMELPAQARTALVGGMGHSKIAIAQIIARICEPHSGSIKIDGLDLNEYDKRKLRSQIYHVTHDPIILNASIRDNIALSRQDASDKQIYKAALLAQAINFIEDMETDEAARSEAIKADLTETFTRLSLNFSNLNGLDKTICQLKDTDLKKTLLDTFKYSDMSFILKIHEAPHDFINFATQALRVNTMTWIDLVMMFEWQLELEQVRKEKLLPKEQLKNLETFCKRHSYTFDVRQVVDGLKTYIYLEQDNQESMKNYNIQRQLFKLTNSTRTNFEQKKRHRRAEIVRGLVDKLKDSSGIFRLPEGFKRKCGKNGCNLSASQQQRIAIARAILFNPKIMIVEDDEDKEGLDLEERNAVLRALENAMQGRTTLLISHQDSNLISKCEKVLVMSTEGKIVEQGSYNDLAQDFFSQFNKFKQGK